MRRPDVKVGQKEQYRGAGWYALHLWLVLGLDTSRHALLLCRTHRRARKVLQLAKHVVCVWNRFLLWQVQPPPQKKIKHAYKWVP